MDQDLYDEFGNYIGPGLEDDSDVGLDSDISAPVSDVEEPEPEPSVTRITRDSIVQYDEDSKVDDVYGDAEVFIREEDTQTIEVPIVKAEESHVERVSNIRRLDSDINSKNFDIMEESMPKNRFSFQFMASLMNQPEFIRNVCIAGNLHDGKTTLVDRLIEHSRFMNSDSYERKAPEFTRYTDTRLDEQARELSIKATPVSLVFQNTLYEGVTDHSDYPKSKSYLFNLFDTPGHVNFLDEFVHALALCDGCVLVVDVLMGLTAVSENIIRQCVHDNVKMCLVVNCLDRLVLELRLPPNDAYLKICHTIGEVNEFVASTSRLLNKPNFVFSPELNNVAFSSATFGIFFTLKSFAKLYSNNKLHEFSKRLYGDYYYNPVNHSITTKSTFTHYPNNHTRPNHSRPNHTSYNQLDEDEDEKYEDIEDNKDNKEEDRGDVNGNYRKHDNRGQENENKPEELELNRTFVVFILEPIYKLISHVASDEREQLEDVLSEFSISLKKDDYKLTTKRILRKVCSCLFTDASSFVDMVISSIPSPLENNYNKFVTHYTGDLTTKLVDDVRNCDKDGQLVVFVAKNYFRNSEENFDLFGRVFSGTLKKGAEIKLLGPSYTLEDDEDMVTRKVGSVWISEARYRVELTKVPVGNWVLISGIDLCQSKTTTVTTVDDPYGMELMVVKQYLQVLNPVFKVGLEPLNPNELPRMISGLRAVERSYPGSVLRVEESGEHVILGTGELYLDCVLHDLRRLYGQLEIKVSDPVVKFTETIMESSSLRCFVNTANQKNKLYMLTQPMQQGVATLIEEGFLFENNNSNNNNDKNNNSKDNSYTIKSEYTNGNIYGVKNEYNDNNRNRGYDLLKDYGWDLLDIRNIWGFGPDNKGPNVLINDTIPSEVDINLLNRVKSSVVQGFNWATKEGPLIEEPIRNVKFRLINCELSDEYVNTTPGQIIPATRRLCYSSFLLSTPRLMEPVVFSEVLCPADCVSHVYTILSRRRGHVLRDMPKPGTPFYMVHSYLPAIESFGFETDLRVHTSGQAFCLSMFDHWNVVPGDPLDKSIVLKPLEPAPIPHLAREFLLKTRKRKGLTEDVSINTFFDDPMLSSLAENLQEFY